MQIMAYHLITLSNAYLSTIRPKSKKKMQWKFEPNWHDFIQENAQEVLICNFVQEAMS